MLRRSRHRNEYRPPAFQILGTSRYLRVSSQGDRDGPQILKERRQGCRERHAPAQEGQAEERQGRKGRHGEKSQAGNRHRTFRSPQEGEESAEEEIFEEIEEEK